ncbi:MAG: lamin tail domain-containing protein [Polyangia bacterium]
MKRSGPVPFSIARALRTPKGRGVLAALLLAAAAASGCSSSDEKSADGGADQGAASAAGSVVLNEVSPHGTDALADPDWAEIKNTGSTPIDLSGYKLRDEKSTAILPPGTILGPGQYLIVYCDDVPDGGATDRLHVPFKLGGQDELHLLRPDGTPVDAVLWDAVSAPAGKSYGRLPDGTGAFIALNPTRGTRNGI